MAGSSKSVTQISPGLSSATNADQLVEGGLKRQRSGGSNHHAPMKFLIRKELRFVAVRGRAKKFGVTSESHEKALKAPRAI